MTPAYQKLKNLIIMKSLDANQAPSLLTIGFRITDNASEKWTQRFNSFKAGDEESVAAGVRTMVAALQGTTNQPGINPQDDARLVVVGAISSRDGVLREGSPVWRLGEGIATGKGWDWNPALLQPRLFTTPKALLLRGI